VEVPNLIEALMEAVRIASDDNNEIFKNLNERETAIVKWKFQARAILKRIEG